MQNHRQSRASLRTRIAAERTRPLHSSQSVRLTTAASLKKTDLSRLYSGILVAIALIVGVHLLQAQHASAALESQKQQAAQATAEVASRDTRLKSQIQSIFARDPQVTFSVSVGDGNDLQTFNSSDASQFDGASTAKLLTAADYLSHVEHGTASLSTMIDGQSAQQLLKVMIINSDDNAWASLNNYLSHDDLTKYAMSIGFQNYDVASNRLTSRDIALLLSKLDNHQLLNAAHRSLLLSYMKQANYRDYIIPAVPASDTVFHKIGLDDDTVNDAAIVSHNNESLQLVIFTDGNGTYDWADRASVMQQITKAVLAADLPNGS